MGNPRVGYAYRVAKFVCKCSQTRSKYKGNLWPYLCLFFQKFGRAFRLCILRISFTLGGLLHAHVRIPTMHADIRFAIVPPSIARLPHFARLPLCSGASAPIPPI